MYSNIHIKCYTLETMDKESDHLLHCIPALGQHPLKAILIIQNHKTILRMD